LSRIKETAMMMKTNKNKRIIRKVVFLLSGILIASCNYNPNGAMNDETTTRGKIKIGVDESFTILTDAELYTFHAFYKYASVTPLYKPELDVLDDFMNDSVRLMITTRKLTKEEIDFLRSKQIIARTTTIAYDALAFIVNKNNRDSNLIFSKVKDIFKGKIKKWDQIDPLNQAGKIKVVFDNNKSANVRFIREKFGIKDSFPKICYAVNNNNEVMNFVEKNVNALGVVGVNWVSDKDDSITRGFLKRVKVVALSAEFDDDGISFDRPYQAYIADNSYPFIREVYAISRETFTGLGSGFIQFVAGDQGQRIVLKMGMVPATMPVRVVQTTSN
jgi:phosphate transport system substrate-binding protein